MSVLPETYSPWCSLKPSYNFITFGLCSCWSFYLGSFSVSLTPTYPRRLSLSLNSASQDLPPSMRPKSEAPPRWCVPKWENSHVLPNSLMWLILVLASPTFSSWETMRYLFLLHIQDGMNLSPLHMFTVKVKWDGGCKKPFVNICMPIYSANIPWPLLRMTQEVMLSCSLAYAFVNAEQWVLQPAILHQTLNNLGQGPFVIHLGVQQVLRWYLLCGWVSEWMNEWMVFKVVGETEANSWRCYQQVTLWEPKVVYAVGA